MKALLRRIRQILRDRRTRRIFTRFVSTAAAIVVFVTTYALVLPAITMESQAACGIEAHQHNDDCFEEALVCGLEESSGHTHTDACYEVTAVLVCGLEEHRHEKDCFDTEGNLICEITEHIHSKENGCYEEKTELICGLEESEGHQHDSSCYKKVLTCGKEIHSHSTACYKSDAADIAVTEDAAVASTESAGFAMTVADEDADEAANSSTDLVITDPEGISGTESTAGTDAATTESTAASAGYVPVLNEIYMPAVLNRKTGIYTATSEAALISATDDAEWRRIDDSIELGENDLLRVYLAYTLPAGSLNETNAAARYRLPANIRLTDEQINSINTTVNGIANQYVNLDTLEILDYESYQASLGIEAVEGTRTPDQDLNDYLTDLQKSGKDAAEYISATVKVENVYDETGKTYLGQDLIFTFTPYTVGKNRHEYDADGQPTKAGEEVSGWIAFDLTTEQIVWDQDDAEENDAKTADIVFAEKDKDSGIHKISTELKLVNTAEDTSEEEKTDEPVSTDDDSDRSGNADDSSTTTTAAAAAEPNNTDENENDQVDNAENNQTENADNSAEEAAQAGTEESASVADDKNESKEENASYPAVSFDDSVTVSAGSLSTDTKENSDNANTNTNSSRSTQITVHVEADEDTFPEGTTMLLSAVSDDRMTTVAEAVEGAVDAQRTMGFHAVDISFRDVNGNEIEPLKPIKVSMSSDAIQRAVEDESTAPVVVHVEDSETHTAETEDSSPAPSEPSAGSTAAEKADSDEKANPSEKEKADAPTVTVIEANTEGSDASHGSADNTLTFEAASFSVYAIVYTVDFEYSVNGKMYQFSLSGGEKIALSDLVEVLGIIDDTNNGEKAAFNSVDSFLKEVTNVEFSDESLVKVTPVEGDWELESLQAFNTEESLTITMKNGDVITVKVTDAQGDPLDGALTSVSITGAYSDDGIAWEVQKEQNYKLSFSFEEIAGDPNKQINVDNTGGVYLTLPTEFSAMNIENQTFAISENGVALQGNTFSVRDGKLYLNLTEDTKTKIRTGNAKFNIDITGSFTQSKENMEFSSTVKRDVTVREDHDLDISKSASYQGWDNRIKYVVTVKSTGYNRNVRISDVISGSGVVLDDGAGYGVTVSSSSGTSSTTIHADKLGFDTVISSLNDGETVSITYYGKPNDSVNGAEPSMSLTGNTATAKTGTVEKEAPAYVTNKISWDNISKSAGESSGEGTEKTLPWTITVNSNKGKDMSGAVVKDQIASDNMVYDTTTPITVTVYEANPNDVWNDVQVDSFTVNWSQVTLSADQKSFEYTLPNTTGNYKYVISYNTKVTVPTDSISDVTVNNNSSVTKDGKTDTTEGTGQVKPAQNVDLKKSVEKVSGDTVEWKISFKVPTSGLSKAIITDTFPNKWLDDGTYRDTLDSSYDITVQEMVNGELSALQKGDTYSIDTSSAEKVVITFSKSDGSAGMTGESNAEREIVIKLKTKFNETWLERKPEDGHTNYVNLNDVITAQATANPSAEKSITKTAKTVGKINIDGTDYPVYKYSLVITGLSGDTLEIEDSFDSDLEYFNIYGQANNVTNQYSGLGIKYTWDETFHATSGDSQQWRTLPSTFIESNPTWNYIEGLRGYTLNTGEAGKVSFRVATSNLPQNNGILYDSYSFDYYLIAKNLDSLNDRSKQVGKAIELSNTATWKGDEDTSSTAKVEYQYPALEKTMIGLGANANNNEIDRGTLETAHAFAKFQIVVNPERTILPVDETTGKIKLTDTFEKLSVDYSTIKIEIEDTNGTRHDVTTATDYNYSGHTGTFNLDNETKYVITYMARIVGDGTVSFNNTAIIDGYKSRVDESATVSSSGGGTVKNYNVRIYKYSGSNMNEAVPGAEYTLVDENGDPILRPSTTKTLTNGKAGTEIKFITDSTGYANVFLSEEDDGISLQEGIKYYLKETRAPEGYQVNPTIYNFTISEHPNYDNNTNYEYYINDILKIWDNKLEGVLEIDKGVTIDGKDSGNSLTDEQKKNIEFTISGSPEDGSAFETLTVDYSSFRNGKYRLENLKPGTYTVTETNYNLTGFTHTDTQATTSDQTSGASVSDYTYTFTIAENEAAGTEHVVSYTNSYTSIPYNFTVQKIDQNNKKLYGAEFKLEKKVDGDYIPLQNGSLDSEGKFSIPYEARENGVTIYNLTDGEYRLTETKAPNGYRATAGEFTFKVENGKLVNHQAGSFIQYTPDGDGSSGTTVITNTVEYGYTLTKAEEGAVTTRLSGAKFAVYEFDTTKEDRKGNLVEELTTGENGQIEILKSNNPAYINNKLYFVVETEAPKGYQLNSKRFYFFWGNYDQGPLHNYDANASAANLGTAQMYSLVEDTPKTVDLKVKKTWNSADIIPAGTTSIDFVVYRTESTPGQAAVTKRYPNSDTVFTLSKGTNDSDTVWTKLTNESLLKNLPVGKSEDGVHTTYTYTIEEISQFEGLESKVQYTSDHNGEQYNIINRPESSEITIHKVWVDGGNDKTSQQVVLCRRNSQGKDTSFGRPWDSPYTIDGGDFGNSNNGNIEITLKKVNDWTATVSALEKGPASDPWIYYVEEPAIPADYTFSVSDPVSSGTITVTNTKKTTGIAVHKVWNLAEDEEVPESVTVQLMKAGEVEDSDAVHIQYYFYADWGSGSKHDLTIKNGSTFSIGHGGLSGDYKIDSGSGTVSFESSKMTISDASDGLVIGMKDTWGYDNLNEEKEYVSAVSPDPTNGTPVSGKTLTLTATNWYGEWKGLDDGYYYITETKVGNTELTSSGYEVTYSNNDGIKTGTITVTNTKTEPQTGKIIVKKSFKGVTGDDLTTLQNALTITITGKDVGGADNNTLELHWSDVQGEGKTIDNLPLNEKYQITESITGDDATAVLAKYEQVTSGADASVTSLANVEPTIEGETKELINSYEPKTTDFEFSKIWKDIGNNPTTWPESTTITVTLNAYTDDVSKKEIGDVTVELSAGGSAAGVTPAWSATVNEDGTVTTFKVEGLQKYKDGKELHYYVIETPVDGYKVPSYATSEGNNLVFTGSDVPKATNGQQIINTPEGGYELPSTGGPGTRLFTILGSILILGAGVLLWRRRRLI